MHTVQYKCPNCGGELVFNPEQQKFSCPFCLDAFTESQMEEQYQEQNQQAMKTADPDMKTVQDETDTTAFEEQTRLYECPSCGAQIIAEETTSATFCYYCHNPVILAGRLSGAYQPNFVMPFAVTREDAEKEFRAWCKKRWFLPSSFQSKQQLEKMSGVYVPFWLADSNTDATYHAIGEKVRSWREGNYRITETTEFDVLRHAKIPFERIPADGAKKIEDALMDAIEPFPYSELRPFSMQYLSGFMAEKYDADWETILPRIQDRMKQASTTVLKETVQGYTNVKHETTTIQTQHIKKNYALLPVWFMSYQHKGKSYHFTMNGQTKKLAGTPPLSWTKLLLCSGGLLAGITLLGGLIGGML